MSDETQSTTQTTQPQTEAAPTAKAYAPDEIERIIAANKALSAENKQRREAEEAARSKADAEAKAKLEAEGKWKEAFEAERREREALAAKAKVADEYSADFQRRLDAALAKLPEERRQRVASFDLSLAAKLSLAEEFLAVTAAPVKAPASTAGAPAPTALPIDLSKMSEAEKAAYFAGKSPDEIRAALGIKPSRGFFAR
jgi:colicin import membrane protein